MKSLFIILAVLALWVLYQRKAQAAPNLVNGGYAGGLGGYADGNRYSIGL